MTGRWDGAGCVFDGRGRGGRVLLFDITMGSRRDCGGDICVRNRGLRVFLGIFSRKRFVI